MWKRIFMSFMDLWLLVPCVEEQRAWLAQDAVVVILEEAS